MPLPLRSQAAYSRTARPKRASSREQNKSCHSHNANEARADYDKSALTSQFKMSVGSSALNSCSASKQINSEFFQKDNYKKIILKTNSLCVQSM